MNDSAKGTKVFIGNLPPDAEGRDLRDFFREYGTVNDAWVARKPPGFGFVWFEDERDARDACRDLDGRDCMGNRVRVEISNGRPGRGGGGGGGGYRGGGGGGYGGRGGGSPRRYGRSPSPRGRVGRSPSPRGGRSRSPRRSPRGRSPPARDRDRSRDRKRSRSPPARSPRRSPGGRSPPRESKKDRESGRRVGRGDASVRSRGWSRLLGAVRLASAEGALAGGARRARRRSARAGASSTERGVHSRSRTRVCELGWTRHAARGACVRESREHPHTGACLLQRARRSCESFSGVEGGGPEGRSACLLTLFFEILLVAESLQIHKHEAAPLLAREHAQDLPNNN